MACSYIGHSRVAPCFLICTAPAIAAEPAPLAELRYDQPAQNASFITT